MLTKLFGDKYYKDLLHAVKKRKKDSESISDADLSSLVMAWSHEGEFKSFTSLRAFRVFSSLPESTKRMATISFPLEKCSGYLLKAILKVHGYSLCERIKSGRYDTKTLRRIYKATTSVLWYRLTKFEGKKLHYLFEIRRAIETKSPPCIKKRLPPSGSICAKAYWRLSKSGPVRSSC